MDGDDAAEIGKETCHKLIIYCSACQTSQMTRLSVMGILCVQITPTSNLGEKLYVPRAHLAIFYPNSNHCPCSVPWLEKEMQHNSDPRGRQKDNIRWYLKSSLPFSLTYRPLPPAIHSHCFILPSLCCFFRGDVGNPASSYCATVGTRRTRPY